MIIELLKNEMAEEGQTTHKMLSRIPDDKLDWQPHPKSMTMKQLATHIAEIPSWVPMMLHTDELDFGSMDYTPTPINSTADIVALFEQSLAAGKASLENLAEADLTPTWTMRNGDTIIRVYTKAEAIRVAYSQTVHHRAQLGVYLRLLNIPIPGSYGPSADDPTF